MACGKVWTVGAAVKELRVDICSNCHPFYTGEQRIVDTEGQIDRFMNRLRVREQHEAGQKAKAEAKVKADIPLEELQLGKRYLDILSNAGIVMVSDLIRKLETEGDEALLSIPGIGVKVLADAKRRISERGYQLNPKA
jgi:large subunit ribosomal protein L31